VFGRAPVTAGRDESPSLPCEPECGSHRTSLRESSRHQSGGLAERRLAGGDERGTRHGGSITIE